MHAAELRSRFLDYFARHGHSIVRSSPLIPQNDPTLFFTNAGMVQFKDTFLGREPRGYVRATTVQKCLRVSGKHNDLENVGHTARHHTFFEMLGNFSFGDYFKTDAIRFAWDLLTTELRIDPNRLWVTVYEQDDEALAIWRDEIGVPAARIQKLGEADNFWSMGDTGPCGPCTEIHYDHGPTISDNLEGPAGGDPRYVEIWNLVFMQYDRDAQGVLTPLPRPSIDTGSGLERVAAVVQGVYTNYDTDLFQPIIQRAAGLAGVTYGADDDVDTSLKVIADHARAAAFLIADGVMPSNEERGYVLRRIMRRGIRYGVKLGLKPPFLTETVGTVIQEFSTAYPELAERARFIRDVVHAEEERFAATLDRGMALLDRELERSPGEVSAEAAFQLADTFGFPVDLTRIIAAERGATVDEVGFDRLREEQRARGRAAWRGSGESAIGAIWHELAADMSTEFSGYTHDNDEGRVVAIVSEGARVTALVEGTTGYVVLDRTPLSAESGGQVGDTGTMGSADVELLVSETTRPAGAIHAHLVSVTRGTLYIGDRLQALVDTSHRDRSRLNHTATHLLHAALRTVLGSHVAQKGSLVAPDRLRFDFSHHKAMTTGEIQAVEDLVNAEILKNRPVDTAVEALDDARRGGAMGLFGEKYGDVVRVVSVGDFSKELCGGTHARRSGDIGLFKVVSEAGIAAGVRRIEAQTGPGALAWLRALERTTRDLAAELKTTPDHIADHLRRHLEEHARLEREVAQLKRELARANNADLGSKATVVHGVRVVAAEIDADPKTLRDEADRLRDSLGSSIVVLAARDPEGVRVLVAVSADLAGTRYNAGKLIGVLAAKVGGRGGGRPDLAQAGGKDAAGLPAMLASVPHLVAEMDTQPPSRPAATSPSAR